MFSLFCVFVPGIYIGHGITIRVCFVSTIGDNVGINEILGLSRMFQGSPYICRICFQAGMIDLCLLEDDELDQIERFQAIFDSNKLRAMPEDRQHPKLLQSLKTGFSFNKVGFADATNVAPGDAMHDIDEGVASYVILGVVSLLVTLYSLEEITKVIAKLPFMNGVITVKESNSEEKTGAVQKFVQNLLNRQGISCSKIVLLKFRGTTCAQKLEMLGRFFQVVPKIEELPDRELKEILQNSFGSRSLSK